MATSWN